MDQELIIRFLVAILCGGLIGLEREYRSKTAGFRTLILICLGACFFTFLSHLIGSPNSPDRIASNIVVGIGFIGAGVIFRGDNTINGITTAATIWVVAAVGMGIGAGYYLVSFVCSVFVTMILTLLPYLEKYIEKLNEMKKYCIVTIYKEDTITEIKKIFDEFNMNYKLIRTHKIKNTLHLEWNVQGHKKAHSKLTKILMEDKNIIEFDC